MRFPDDFLWGGSLSAIQSEGSWNKDGKGISIGDVLIYDPQHPHNITFNGVENGTEYCYHFGNDFYHRYKEDIKLFSEAGFRSLRFSINWSRIYPNGDDETPNEKGLQFYENVINELLKFNIKPIITLTHTDMPLNLAKNGSWLNRVTVDCFVKYCKTVFERYKGKVSYWLPFNEVNALSLTPWFTAGLKNDISDEDLIIAGYHIFLASAKITLLAHEIDKNNKVGMMFGGFISYPYSCNPKDVLAHDKFMHEMLYYSDVICNGEYPKYKLREIENNNYQLPVREDDLEIIKKGTADFVAFSYYFTTVIGKDTEIKRGYFGDTGYSNPYLEYTKWGWAIDPDGLRYMSNLLYDRYHLPLMVVENGLGAVDKPENDNTIHDDYRIEYIKRHIEVLKETIDKDGINIMGYHCWGCCDLVSGNGEMKKRYGLIYVDTDGRGNGTFNRFKKDSFYWYKKVIESNGECLD